MTDRRSGAYAHVELTREILGCGIRVHRELGPGLLENVYRACLTYELSAAGLAVQQEMAIPIAYREVCLDCGYRADLVVNESVIVELKTVERLLPIHEAQLLTYLKLAHIKVGLLLNFNATSLRKGIRRLIR